MDRKISEDEIKKRNRKRIIKFLLIGSVIIVAFIILINILQTGISKDNIIISEVDKGTLEITFSSIGKVHPIYEEVISSPVASKILDVYKKAGDTLVMEDIILKLDLDVLNIEMEKQNDELSMKKYRLEQLKSSAVTALSDLEVQIEIEEMKLRRMEVLLRNEEYLDSIGASTQDKIKQAHLEFEVDKLRLKQQKLKLENLKLTFSTDIKIAELDYNIAVKDANLKNKTQAESQIKSPRAATLTWVNDQIGANVQPGAQIATVADLKNYKIVGDISDNYGDRFSSGNKAIIKIGNQILTGIVGNIVPSVKNGIINFTVLLDDQSNSLLRSGLKVDIHIVNYLKESVLRIDNRSFYKGEGEYYLWVVDGNKAIKRKIVLGECNFEKIEVKEGLKEGEKVIVSDMNQYNDKNKLTIL